ncbi:7tm 7 domain containing protein [Asbolus verrucosus]|uniref:Gustatory receptor n=1 Tax=Asbolus verrucosus TaxID=1661398 RepID=A0A482WBY7_ASBVE|nr:7tm 7 domain containing protein [Asbolus verrucosus]
MDLSILETIVRMGRMLALTPASVQNQVPNSSEKFYPVFMFLFYSVGVIVSKYYLRLFYAYLTPIQLTLTILIVLGFYIQNSYIFLIIALKKRQLWLKFVENLRMVAPKPTGSRQNYFIFIVPHVLYCVNNTLGTYMCIHILGWRVIKLYLLEYFDYYSHFFYTVYTCVILNLILSRYQHQAAILSKITRRKLRFSKEVATIFENVKRDVCVLKATVDIFNDIFGPVVLLNILVSALRNLANMEVITKGGVILFVIHEVCAMSLIWIGLLAIIFLCDAVLKEHEEILALTSKMQLSIDLCSHEHAQLEIFIHVVSNNRPVFKAARFFSIDRSTFFSILNTITTSFLVIIQFKTR